MNTLKRYANLVRNVRTWPMYFWYKLRLKRPEEYRFAMRGIDAEVRVPAALLGTFKEIFMTDVYRLQELRAAMTKDPIIVDVGANIGMFSVAMMSVLPKGRIHAFEPLPANFEYLERNARGADSWGGSLHCHPKAVVGSGGPEKVAIHFDPDRRHTPVASVLKTFTESNRESLEVEACSLGEIVKSNALPHIDLLKLDCEGAEYEILYDTTPATLLYIRRIVMETHDLDAEDRCSEAMVRFLTKNGFEVRTEAAGDGTSTLWAQK